MWYNICDEPSAPSFRQRRSVMLNAFNFRAASFTGHRHFSEDEKAMVFKKLDTVVKYLIEERDFRVFRTGGALGFDTMAAYTILGYRHLYPDIRLELYLPCPDQARYWGDEDKKSYEYIKAHADKIIYTSEHYFTGCMHLRNRRLITGTMICVTYFRGGSEGGTAYTVDYARQQGLEIINLCDLPNAKKHPSGFSDGGYNDNWTLS